MLLQASIYIVFALLLIVSALLLLVVLMQRPKQEGLGAAFGAQMTDQAFGAQTTDVLKKGTVFFGTLFMLFAFVLGVLMNALYKRSHSSELAKQPAAAKPQPVEAAPAAPAVEEVVLPAEAASAPAEETPAAEPAEPQAESQPAAAETTAAPEQPAEAQ